MADKEIENYFFPSLFGNIKWGDIEFAFSEGYNFEVLETLPNGYAKGILCNLEGDLAALNGKIIEVKSGILQLIEV